MLDSRVKPEDDIPLPRGKDVITAVRELSSQEIFPLAQKIDAEGYYPEAVMRALGRAGAFATHLPGKTRGPDLVTAIRAMSAVGEHCLSTSFCMWCQNALGWYIFASDNDGMKEQLGQRVATGDALGGTALSNPMKTFFGMEQIRLKAKRVYGGYVVRGLLPFVSNLGPNHYFAAVFEVEHAPKHYVMAVVSCSAEGVSLTDNSRFLALNGTRTFAVELRDVMVPESWVLADPSDTFIGRIRAGFVLMQTGMAFGLVRNCIELMSQTRRSLDGVNKYLDVQPEHIAEQLAAMKIRVERLAMTPFEGGSSFWRAVIEERLAMGEISIGAAHAAMLHCGARGFVTTGAAQRRLREAYFMAILTPATKQLKKMLAEMKE